MKLEDQKHPIGSVNPSYFATCCVKHDWVDEHSKQVTNYLHCHVLLPCHAITNEPFLHHRLTSGHCQATKITALDMSIAIKVKVVCWLIFSYTTVLIITAKPILLSSSPSLTENLRLGHLIDSTFDFGQNEKLKK